MNADTSLSKRHDITYEGLPDHLREGAQRYIEDGIMPGRFLQSALTNEFVSAVLRADHRTAVSLAEIARWLFNDIPGSAWGSEDAVAAWSAQGGLRGEDRG